MIIRYSVIFLNLLKTTLLQYAIQCASWHFIIPIPEMVTNPLLK